MNTNQALSELRTEPYLGNRILAGFVDYLIIYGFLIIYVYAFGQPNEEGGYSVNGLPALVPVLVWGLMTIGLEQFFGSTLGNGLVGLKPISIKQEIGEQTWGNFKNKPTFVQSLKRHLLDPIDMFFFGLVGILTIKNSPLHQRVGDMWAKTIVVKNKSDK